MSLEIVIGYGLGLWMMNVSLSVVCLFVDLFYLVFVLLMYNMGLEMIGDFVFILLVFVELNVDRRLVLMFWVILGVLKVWLSIFEEMVVFMVRLVCLLFWMCEIYYLGMYLFLSVV